MRKNYIFIVILIIAVTGGCLYFFLNKKEDTEIKENIANVTNLEANDEVEEIKPELTKNIKIFNGDSRPIAFMIDNNKNAQPQASLNSTYMVYEIIVEGGETRLMALFKGKTCDEVGPIRSARHYFLDYVMENDAIYAHLGLSPQAQSQMLQYGINNINGQSYDTGKARTASSLYWRVKHKKAPHNAYTNTEAIKQIAENKGYRTKSDKESVLNYVENEVILDGIDSIVANNIVLPYTNSHKVEYKYNKETQRYTRYSKGKKIFDETTDEEVTTKNLIITFAENYTLNDGENKGRQDVITTGSLDGYYITNGKAIKIKCNKASREAQTVYVDLLGNEIEVNDGNTWVNIVPIDAEVSITE